MSPPEGLATAAAHKEDTGWKSETVRVTTDRGEGTGVGAHAGLSQEARKK